MHPENSKSYKGVASIGEEIAAIDSLELSELEKYPSSQLCCLASSNMSLENRGRLLLASATKGDPMGQFLLSSYYVSNPDRQENMWTRVTERQAAREQADREQATLFAEDLQASEYCKLLTKQENQHDRVLIANCDAMEYQGLPQEYQIASAYWAGEAAKHGLPEALNNYAVYQLVGFGVQQNFPEAFEGFKKAAENGLAFAQFNLGVCYANGYGTDQNSTFAGHWFEEAAKQGMEYANFNLAVAYDLGEGVQPDPARAVELYENIGNRKIGRTDPFDYIHIDPQQFCSDDAKNNLAVCYELGNGVQQCYEEAAKLYSSLAVLRISSEAIKNIAVCYELGLGVPQNLKNAELFYDGLSSMCIDQKREYISESDKNPTRAKMKDWIFMVPNQSIREE